MEALLSLAFDNIASLDSSKIRKGLRQIEGLLAQICLSKANSRSSTPAHRRTTSAIHVSEQNTQSSKKLGGLVEDPAFREFFRLQESFEWNVATRLVACLERLLGVQANGANDLLILSALSNLQGLLLLHPPSRTIFGCEIYMNLLLDLLVEDPNNCPAIPCSTLLVLVTALLATPHNTRVFEKMDGLLTVTSLFKSQDTPQNVKLKLLEFMYFYLMPEIPPSQSSRPSTSAGLQRSPSKLLSAFEKRRNSSVVNRDDRSSVGRDGTRSTEEKQRMLGQYINNVDDLVQDLRENAPSSFAEVSCN